MPQGLQCWDAAGNLTVDITDRLTRILGQMDIGPTDTGYITHPGFASGFIWYTVYNKAGAGAGYTPKLTIEAGNNRIHYEPRDWATGVTIPTVLVIFGVY